MSKKEKHFAEFVELRKSGHSFNAISQQLDVSKQSLINWSKTESVKEEIEIERLSRIQDELNKMGQHQEAKIIFYCSLSKAIVKEIETRDLSQLPIDRLITLLFKTEERIESLSQGTLFSDKEPFADAFNLLSFNFDPKT